MSATDIIIANLALRMERQGLPRLSAEQRETLATLLTDAINARGGELTSANLSDVMIDVFDPNRSDLVRSVPNPAALRNQLESVALGFAEGYDINRYMTEVLETATGQTAVLESFTAAPIAPAESPETGLTGANVSEDLLARLNGFATAGNIHRENVANFYADAAVYTFLHGSPGEVQGFVDTLTARTDEHYGNKTLVESLGRNPIFQPYPGQSFAQIAGTDSFESHPVVQMLLNMGEENRDRLFGGTNLEWWLDQLHAAGVPIDSDLPAFIRFAYEHANIIEDSHTLTTAISTGLTSADLAADGNPETMTLLDAIAALPAERGDWQPHLNFEDMQLANGPSDLTVSDADRAYFMLDRVLGSITPSQLTTLLGAADQAQRETMLSNPHFRDLLAGHGQLENAVAFDYDVRRDAWLGTATPEQIYALAVTGDAAAAGFTVPDYITLSDPVVADFAADLEERILTPATDGDQPAFADRLIGSLDAAERAALIDRLDNATGLSDDAVAVLRQEHTERTVAERTAQLAADLASGRSGSIQATVDFLINPEGAELYGVSPDAFLASFAETLSRGESVVYNATAENGRVIQTRIDGLSVRGLLEMLNGDQRDALLADPEFAAALESAGLLTSATNIDAELDRADRASAIERDLTTLPAAAVEAHIAALRGDPLLLGEFVRGLTPADVALIYANLGPEGARFLSEDPFITQLNARAVPPVAENEAILAATGMDLAPEALDTPEAQARLTEIKAEVAAAEHVLMTADPTSPEYLALAGRLTNPAEGDYLPAVLASNLSAEQYFHLLDRLPEGLREQLLSSTAEPSFHSLVEARLGGEGITLGDYLRQLEQVEVVSQVANLLRDGAPQGGTIVYGGATYPATDIIGVLSFLETHDTDDAGGVASDNLAARVFATLSEAEIRNLAATLPAADVARLFGPNSSLRDELPAAFLPIVDEVITSNHVEALTARVAAYNADPADLFSFADLMAELEAIEPDPAARSALLASVLAPLETGQIAAWAGNDLSALIDTLPEGSAVRIDLDVYQADQRISQIANLINTEGLDSASIGALDFLRPETGSFYPDSATDADRAYANLTALLTQVAGDDGSLTPAEVERTIGLLQASAYSGSLNPAEFAALLDAIRLEQANGTAHVLDTLAASPAWENFTTAAQDHYVRETAAQVDVLVQDIKAHGLTVTSLEGLIAAVDFNGDGSLSNAERALLEGALSDIVAAPESYSLLTPEQWDQLAAYLDSDQTGVFDILDTDPAIQDLLTQFTAVGQRHFDELAAGERVVAARENLEQAATVAALDTAGIAVQWGAINGNAHSGTVGVNGATRDTDGAYWFVDNTILANAEAQRDAGVSGRYLGSINRDTAYLGDNDNNLNGLGMALWERSLLGWNATEQSRTLLSAIAVHPDAATRAEGVAAIYQYFMSSYGNDLSASGGNARTYADVIQFFGSYLIERGGAVDSDGNGTPDGLQQMERYWNAIDAFNQGNAASFTAAYASANGISEEEARAEVADMAIVTVTRLIGDGASIHQYGSVLSGVLLTDPGVAEQLAASISARYLQSQPFNPQAVEAIGFIKAYLDESSPYLAYAGELERYMADQSAVNRADVMLADGVLSGQEIAAIAGNPELVAAVTSLQASGLNTVDATLYAGDDGILNRPEEVAAYLQATGLITAATDAAAVDGANQFQVAQSGVEAARER